MHPLALARLGLMGLGKLPGFLFRGTGWRRGATGPVQTRPATVTPYTPVRRRFRGRRGKYEPVPTPTRTVYDRVPRGTTVETTGLYGQPRTVGTGGRFTFQNPVRYLPLRQTLNLLDASRGYVSQFFAPIIAAEMMD